MERKVKKLRFKRKSVEDSPQAVSASFDKRDSLSLHLFNTIVKQTSVQKVCEVIVEFALKIFNVEGAAVFLTDSESKHLSPIAFSVKKEIRNKDLMKKFSLEKISVDANLATAKAFKTGGVYTSSGQIAKTVKEAGFNIVFSVPITLRGKNIGVFSLARVRKDNLSDRQLEMLQLLATHLSLKINQLNTLEKVDAQKNTMEILQNAVSEGLSLHGPDGTIFYANKAVSKLLGTTKSTAGLKREELLNNWDKYHRFSMERLYDIEEMRRTVYEEKKPFNNALMKINSQPPKYIEADYFPIVSDKKLKGTAASYRDITKLKLQEIEITRKMQELTTEKEKWEAIFANVDEGICLLDRDLSIVHMNSACELATGQSLQQVVGKNYYQVFGCHTKDGLYYPDFAPLEKVLITKEPISYEEHLHVTHEGEQVWVGFSASPIKDHDGEIKEIVLVIRDISSLKEVEKAKSEFVSIASHELRTPLTVVNGYLSLLLSGDLGDFTDEVSRNNLRLVLLKATNETERLTRLVSDLLDVSRIEDNRINLERRQVCIDELVEQVREQVGNLARTKRIQFVAPYKARQAKIFANCDRAKIYQAIFNLVDNSIKFTPEGGKVEINYWQKDGSIFISVEDNGIGIPKKLQSIIFEKFQQVPGSYLKENRGTGLGLFIVKSLIELHQGNLELESDLGKGTKFTFSLPLGVA